MRRLLAILMLAAAVLSCAADVDMSRPLSGGPVFSGRFDSKDAERCWSSGDIISLFIGTTYNHQYAFQGQNGATEGDFRETSTPVWLSQKTVAANYAVFPYSTSLSLTTTGDLMVSLPKLQHYAGGNPDQSSNIMFAATAEKTSKSPKRAMLSIIIWMLTASFPRHRLTVLLPDRPAGSNLQAGVTETPQRRI